jgi:hypothetical protein
MVWIGALLALPGCAHEEGRVPVRGTVTWDGQPLENAAVTFEPLEGTSGAGGIGSTTKDGSYSLVNPQRMKGVMPGKYRVTVSQLDMPKIDQTKGVVQVGPDRKEKLPPRYSDPEKTELTATVEKTGTTIDFSLKTEK